MRFRKKPYRVPPMRAYLPCRSYPRMHRPLQIERPGLELQMSSLVISPTTLCYLHYSLESVVRQISKILRVPMEVELCDHEKVPERSTQHRFARSTFFEPGCL